MDSNPIEQVRQYVLSQRVATTSSSVVHRAKCDVAVKEITNNVVGQFDREVKALQRLQHPNIVRLLDAFTNHDGRQFIVTEWLTPLDTETCDRYTVAQQILLGVDFMHSNDWVHHDIKLDNTMYCASTRQAKLIDFGFSHRILYSGKCRCNFGTPSYASLELLSLQDPIESRAADVWSCGVLLFQIFAGCLPFPVVYSLADHVDNLRTMEYRRDLLAGEEIRSALDRMLVRDPERRWPLIDVLALPLWSTRATSIEELTSADIKSHI
jgi:5'-AMP-activated protein kinase catalytic alpha subunit